MKRVRVNDAETRAAFRGSGRVILSPIRILGQSARVEWSQLFTAGRTRQRLQDSDDEAISAGSRGSGISSPFFDRPPPLARMPPEVIENLTGEPRLSNCQGCQHCQGCQTGVRRVSGNVGSLAVDRGPLSGVASAQHNTALLLPQSAIPHSKDSPHVAAPPDPGRGAWPVCSFALAQPAAAQKPFDDPVLERMQKDVFFLASPECEGRGIDTKGIEKAADYVVDAFKAAGLKPAMKDGSYFQPFTRHHVRQARRADRRLTLTGPTEVAKELEARHRLQPDGVQPDREGVGRAGVRRLRHHRAGTEVRRLRRAGRRRARSW